MRRGFYRGPQGRAHAQDHLADSLTALGCMEHRGACSADDDSGDGAGIMCDIPWKVLGAHCDAAGIAGFEEGKSGVGMVFLPRTRRRRRRPETLEASIKAEGLTVLGWRAVPVNKGRRAHGAGHRAGD